MELLKYMKKAQTSSFYRRLLSIGLNRMVPFNRPHRFKIIEVKDDLLAVNLPYIRRNLNHLKGLHACAMATLAEVCSGFLLISKLDPKKYRLILRKLDMDYHYQGKSSATAIFSFTEEWWKEQILEPIEKDGISNVVCEVEIKDEEGNLLSSGKAHWQIKDWQKVKTK